MDRTMPIPVLPTKRKVLMVDPEHFDVKYAINPFMSDSAGKLNKIDKAKAREQWAGLADAYRKLAYEVIVLNAQPELPDMVFAANQSLPFWMLGEIRPAVVMARMASPFRKAEVAFFSEWYAKNGYRIFLLPDDGITFEGNGDVLIQNSLPVIWAASGPRTTSSVWKHLEEITGYQVNTLVLRHPEFYHLDTCFSVLTEDTVALYPGAFDDEDLRRIRRGFLNVIEIDYEECSLMFAGNCHSPDGKNVIVQPGAERFQAALVQRGFNVVEVETSEFMKSGGSVFCMKMMAY